MDRWRFFARVGGGTKKTKKNEGHNIHSQRHVHVFERKVMRTVYLSKIPSLYRVISFSKHMGGFGSYGRVSKLLWGCVVGRI